MPTGVEILFVELARLQGAEDPELIARATTRRFGVQLDEQTARHIVDFITAAAAIPLRDVQADAPTAPGEGTSSTT